MGRRLAKRASNRIKELNERRLDSSISREKCVQCAWFLYTFLPVLFYFYLSPPPPMQFSALCKQKSAAKKKGEKKKQNKRIVSLFRTGKNFYRFFFSPSLPHFDNFDSFFQLVLSFDKMGKLALINSRVESHYSRPGYDLFFLLERREGRSAISNRDARALRSTDVEWNMHGVLPFSGKMALRLPGGVNCKEIR